MTTGGVRKAAAASRQPLSSALLEEAMRNYFRRRFDGVTDAELDLRIEETLRFLFISQECKGSIPVSREIDDIWHAWILQTQRYFALCERLPAGSYVHHSSNDYLRHFDPHIGEQEDLQEAVRMLALYVANFGPFDECTAGHWLLVRHMITSWGWTLPKINDWLLAGGTGAPRELTDGDGNRTTSQSGQSS
jgi:hypothetical protein